MMHREAPTTFSRRGSMPGRMQRRASLSGKPERRGSMGKRGPSRVMLSWFQAAETVEEPEQVQITSTLPPQSSSTPIPVQKTVQITGLELLKKDSKYEDESDDFSYDSYAKDSFVLSNKRVRKMSSKPLHIRLVQSEHQTKRRASNSSAEDDDDLDSMARDYYDYGPCRAARDPKRWNARRGSVGSFANDSVEFAKFKTTRRASIESYANDSVECRNATRSRYANPNALGTSWHGRSKFGRRSSLGSQTMDSSSGYRFAAPCRGRMTRRHSSHSGTLEMMQKSIDGPRVLRRSSLGSMSSGVSLSVATSLSAGISRTT